MPAVAPVPAVEWDTSPKPTVTPAVPANPFVFDDPAVQAFHDSQWARMFAPSYQVTCQGPCFRSYTIAHNHHTGTCAYCRGTTSAPVVVGTTFDSGAVMDIPDVAVHPAITLPSLDAAKIPKAQSLWQSLHQYPVDHQSNWTYNKSRVFLDTWIVDVRDMLGETSTCSCASYLLQYLATTPAQLTTPKEFFKWGFDLHNSINDKLAKDTFLPEYARSRYNTPADWLT